MNTSFKTIWETYTQSWNPRNESERLELFQKSLNKNCVYSDPLTTTAGWEQLISYMKTFHKQIPGAYFETTSFLSHNNKSIAQWNMKSHDHNVIGTGISYGEYSTDGKLLSMTGFYEVPKT